MGTTGTRRNEDTVVASPDGLAEAGWVGGGWGMAVRGVTGIVEAGEACAVSACMRVAGVPVGVGIDVVGWALTNELAGA